MLLRAVAATACLSAGVSAALLWAHAPAPDGFTSAAQLIPQLLAAHRDHPRSTSVSLELGLELERSGDLPRAAQILEDAARYDHQYLPAWTLANFYFRAADTPRFWEWAARAAALNPGDFRPLLQLASHWEPDPASLLARLGRRPELLRAYLDLLIAGHHWDATRVVASALHQHHDPADLPRFAALDHLLSQASPR